MSVVSFTLTILVLYLGGMKLVSYWAYKRSVASSEDYFLANRQVGIFALVATSLASIFSTGTVVSSPSEFFTEGSGYFWILFFISVPVALIPFAFRFWALGHAKGFVTPGDLLGDFYRSKAVKMMAALIGILALMPYAAAQLVAIGKTFEALTGGIVNYEIGVSIVCAAMGLYLYFGGSRAVIWTDMVQGVIFSGLLIAAGVMAMQWAGGWTAMNEVLLTQAPEKATFNAGLAYFEYFPIVMAFFLLPHVWQRMYMAKSAQIIAKNIVLLGGVFIVLFFITWIIGTAGHTLFPDGLTDGDSLLGALFNQNAPYFGALVLVAAFAAGMSTVDSQLLSAGSIITHDVVPQPTGARDQKKDFVLARWSTMVLLVLIFVWSLFLQSQSIIDLIILGVSMPVIMVPAVVGMFYWRRASTSAALWSMALGLAVFVVKYFTPLGDHFPTALGASSWSFIVAIVVFVVVSLLTSPDHLADKRAEYKAILS